MKMALNFMRNPKLVHILVFKLKHSSSCERCLLGKNYSMYGLGIAQPLY